MALQRIGLGGLEPDVQVQQLLAHLGPVVEVRVQGQAGELPQQVHGVFVPVGGIVEHGVGVGENLLGGDAVLPGQGLKFLAPLLPVVVVDAVDAPLGNVADPFAVRRVAVEGQALGLFGESLVRHTLSVAKHVEVVWSRKHRKSKLPYSDRVYRKSWEHLRHLVLQ